MPGDIAILLDPRTFLSARTILGEELATKANTLLSEAIENAVLAQVCFEDETSCTEDTRDSITSSRREQAVTPERDRSTSNAICEHGKLQYCNRNQLKAEREPQLC